MRALSFFVGGELFAIDVTLVEKVSRRMIVTPIPTAPDAVIGITNMKGKVVTLFNLHELLGHTERRSDKRTFETINAIIFKAVAGDEAQMGLSIEKPGELIYISDDIVCSPAQVTGTEESFCITGIAELNNRLYRIVDIVSIINKYKTRGQKTAENISGGGY